MSAGKNAMLAAGGLAALEAGSGGLGSGLVSVGAENIVETIRSAADGVVSTVDPFFTGGIPTALTAGWALWTGSDKYSEKGIPGVVESAAWRYGIMGTALTAAGIASMPATLAALGVGGALMATRGVTGLGKDVGENPGGILGGIVKAPFKGIGWAANAFRGRGAPATP